LRRADARTLARLLCLVAACVLASWLPAAARADGDPASDVLPLQDVFTPYPAPNPTAVAALRASVARVFAGHRRLKVAVIAKRADLGAIPSLFGKPGEYAHFLGAELRTFYVGPLLIVMPSGFGIYDGGRSTAAEAHALGGLKPNGSNASALVGSATTAVDRLAAANALRSKDVFRPAVYPQVPFVKAGQTVSLRYSVLEDSERARDFLSVFAGRKRLASYSSPLRTALYTKPHTFKWKVPEPAPADLRFCVYAVDGSGNRGRQTCLPIKVVTP
jgi:hypothetical protein